MVDDPKDERAKPVSWGEAVIYILLLAVVVLIVGLIVR